jgi:hypothetical protein
MSPTEVKKALRREVPPNTIEQPNDGKALKLKGLSVVDFWFENRNKILNLLEGDVYGF